MEKLEQLIVDHLWCAEKAAQRAAYKYKFDYDEAYSIACLCLVKIAGKWRGDAKFSVFFYRCVDNEFLMEFRNRKTLRERAFTESERDVDSLDWCDVEEQIIARDQLKGMVRLAWRSREKKVIDFVAAQMRDESGKQTLKKLKASSRVFYAAKSIAKQVANG